MDISAFIGVIIVFIIFPAVLARLLFHFAMTSGDDTENSWKEEINESKNDSI